MMGNDIENLKKVIAELTEENERLRCALANKEQPKVNWDDIENQYANYYSEV